jgi:dipeptidyl aminopeptidase/acylaminoacyl peptidase
MNMIRDRQAQACGSWPSPISAAMIVEQGVRLFQPQISGDCVYWLETRPSDKGRTVLVMKDAEGGVTDLTPKPFSTRSCVHEYGGGAFHVSQGEVWFVEFRDQQIYKLDGENLPKRVSWDEHQRHADIIRDRSRSRIVCVCEDHREAGEPRNFVAAITDDGLKNVLASGYDFYSTPGISPDGSQLSWLCWRHPQMPWDGTELWIGEFDEDGTIVQPRCIAGGKQESIGQPRWGPDGRLYFVSDRNNWWNLYAWNGESIETLTTLEAELGLPQWVFGQSTYGFPDEETIVFAATAEGRWKLYRMPQKGGDPVQLDFPYDTIEHVSCENGRTVVLAGTAESAPGIYQVSDDGPVPVTQSNLADIPPGFLSSPESISFATGDGNETAHGLFYAPVNEYYEPLEGESPPLIINCHGGPTSAAGTALDLRIQFWTSRGFAVLDLNYRGSTGYGRKYRRSLYGRWGQADVEDCVAGARCLSEAGRINGDRLLISGGSAGGYTVLCALAFTDAFRSGASYFGVGDPESMFAATHKFESRYDHWLIGDWHNSRAVYRTRSPLRNADQIDCPVIFFQGADDKVVPPEQSRVMVETLKKRGLPVAYLEFQGEAHGFRKADAVSQSIESELYFFCRILDLPPPEGIAAIKISNSGSIRV